MKILVCADVATSFCVNFQVNFAKEGHRKEIGQGTRVVLQLTEHLQCSGRNCTGDNIFSSLVLSRALLGRSMTYIGTVRKNNPFIPADMKNMEAEMNFLHYLHFKKIILWCLIFPIQIEMSFLCLLSMTLLKWIIPKIQENLKSF